MFSGLCTGHGVFLGVTEELSAVRYRPPAHAKPTHLCSHPALPGQGEQQLPLPSFFFKARLRSTEERTLSPARHPQVRGSGGWGGPAALPPSRAWGSRCIVLSPEVAAAAAPRPRGGGEGGRAGLVPLRAAASAPLAAKDSPRLSLARFPPRPVSSRGRHAGPCSAAPRLRLATAGRRDSPSRRAPRRPPAAAPAGSCSAAPAPRAVQAASGDCISQRAPRPAGCPPRQSPQRPRAAAARSSTMGPPHRRPAPARRRRPVTDVYGEALGVLQVAKDFIGREGNALVQTAVTAAPSPAPLRHFERDPLLGWPHRHANVCAYIYILTRSGA